MEIKSKNEIAWEELFKKYDILNKINNDGKYIINSRQIREYREPRLMTKFDHKINLPNLFKQNELSILPITRHNYIISHFNTYHNIEKISKKMVNIKMPYKLESLDQNNIKSEQMAINLAYASGILNDFLSEGELYPTVSGRQSSKEFEFNINNTKNKNMEKINVKNAQMEIDAAYEGLNSLSIIEAKLDISNDFIIRQLFYPYMTWTDRVNKVIRPIFFIYSNGIYDIYEYTFNKKGEYNSIELVRNKSYKIKESAINYKDIEDVIKNTKIIKEEDIPFPQANDFKRIINLCELLNNNDLTREEITNNYEFDVRQTNYYTDACRYLGLIYKEKVRNGVRYKLTKSAKETLKKGYRERQLEFCKIILKHYPFNKTIKLWLKSNVKPQIKDILKIMKQAKLYKIESINTYTRRASTIISWLEWIMELADE